MVAWYARTGVLQAIADHLENWLGLNGEEIGTAAYYGALKADDLPKAFAQIKRLVKPPADRSAPRAVKRSGRLQATAQLTKARENLVLLDPTNIPAAEERIRQLSEERAAIDLELKQCKPPGEEKDINAVALKCRKPSTRSPIVAWWSPAKPTGGKWKVHGSLGIRPCHRRFGGY